MAPFSQTAVSSGPPRRIAQPKPRSPREAQEPPTRAVKNPFSFLWPRDKQRSRPKYKWAGGTGTRTSWGVGEMVASDSQLLGLAMGHASSGSLELCREEFGRLI